MLSHGFLKVACATPLLVVGNPKFNALEIKKILDNSKASITVFPELSLTGYTCGDLFYQKALLEEVIDEIKFLLDNVNYKGIYAIGAPLYMDGSLYNTAVVIKDNNILGVVPKRSLPNSKEYYEKRWFKSGNTTKNTTIDLLGKTYPFGNLIFKDVKNEIAFGIEICEDMWAPVTPGNILSMDGANIILNLSASNETLGKSDIRRSTVLENSRRNAGAYVYASAGVNESTSETVFSGHNIIALDGVMLKETENFSIDSEIIYADLDIDSINYARRINTNLHDDINITLNPSTVLFSLEEVKDYSFEQEFDRTPYVPKKDLETTFNKIASLQEYALFKRLKHTNTDSLIIGISGGLDSTLALLVAYEAYKKLGKDMKNIIAVTMPGMGTSNRTKNNALELMKKLGLTVLEKPIVESVKEHFKLINHDPDLEDLTYENAQARIRTLILMDLANMHNGLVLGTGDMSEIALGWSTYNGDQMSMYGINCGIPKTLVKFMVSGYAMYKLPELKEVLLDIVNTPITPELTQNQNTEDLVGKYEVNDFIMNRYLTCGDTEERLIYLVSNTFKELTEEEVTNYVNNFLKRFYSQQFKREASPDGPKILSFGLSPRADMRLPSDIKRW